MKNDNSYYTVLVRKNIIKPLLQDVIVSFSSYPALIVEIFTRQSFGQRYLPFISCVTAILVMLFFGMAATEWQGFIQSMFRGSSALRSDNGFGADETLLILFAIVALVVSYRHKQESKRQGRTIDFQRFSLSCGQSRSYWYDLAEKLPSWIYERLPVNETNLRRYYEPFSAMLIGVVLIPLPFTRSLGIMLLVCGFFYYMRTRIQYSWGQEWILNMIDKKILAEEAQHLFIQEKPSNETRGVMVMAPLPQSEDLRQELYESMKEDLEGRQQHLREEEYGPLIL